MVAAVSLLGGLVGAVIGSSPAAALTAGAPQPLVFSDFRIQQSNLFGVACPTATTCYAVGNTNAGPVPVVTIVNGVVGPINFPDADTYSLHDIACPTATTCYAVGESNIAPDYPAALVPIVNGVIGATVGVPGAANLTSIACPTATTCIAVGYQFDPVTFQDFAVVVVPIVNGVPGPAQRRPELGQLDDIACATATTCYAVGTTFVPDPNGGNSTSHPFVLPIVNGIAGTPQPVVVGSETQRVTELSAIACPTATTCYAAGAGSRQIPDGSFRPLGVVVTITNGTPGSIQFVDAPPPSIYDDGLVLQTIACTSEVSCIAGGYNLYPPPGTGELVPITDGVAGPARKVANTQSFRDIACPTATSCVAVGSQYRGGYINGVVVALTDAGPSCNGKPATIVGTPRDDRLFGTPGDDVIVGMGGNDQIYGYGGNDTICANNGNDVVYGGDGNDYIDGGAGNDTLVGDAGNDTVLGGDGSDRLFASAGTDTLDGGPATDYCYKGTGTTSFTACEVFPNGK